LADEVAVDVVELAAVMEIPVDETDLEALVALWSLYRSGLLQMEAELDGSGITTWMGLERPE
jgi:hypothetical protein